MKVAISIPDPVFNEAEALARRLKLSRSKMYARAVGDFVERNRGPSLTEQINAMLDEIGDEGPDEFLRETGRRVFRRLDE